MASFQSFHGNLYPGARLVIYVLNIPLESFHIPFQLLHPADPRPDIGLHNLAELLILFLIKMHLVKRIERVHAHMEGKVDTTVAGSRSAASSDIHNYICKPILAAPIGFFYRKIIKSLTMHNSVASQRNQGQFRSNPLPARGKKVEPEPPLIET